MEADRSSTSLLPPQHPHDVNGDGYRTCGAFRQLLRTEGVCGVTTKAIMGRFERGIMAMIEPVAWRGREGG